MHALAHAAPELQEDRTFVLEALKHEALGHATGSEAGLELISGSLRHQAILVQVTKPRGNVTTGKRVLFSITLSYQHGQQIVAQLGGDFSLLLIDQVDEASIDFEFMRQVQDDFRQRSQQLILRVNQMVLGLANDHLEHVDVRVQHFSLLVANAHKHHLDPA